MAARILEITFIFLLFPVVFGMINAWGIFDQTNYAMSTAEYQSYTISNLTPYDPDANPGIFDTLGTAFKWMVDGFTGVVRVAIKFIYIYPQLIALFPMIPAEILLIMQFGFWFDFVLFIASLRYPQFGEHTQ